MTDFEGFFSEADRLGLRKAVVVLKSKRKLECYCRIEQNGVIVSELDDNDKKAGVVFYPMHCIVEVAFMESKYMERIR